MSETNLSCVCVFIDSYIAVSLLVIHRQTAASDMTEIGYTDDDKV